MSKVKKQQGTFVKANVQSTASAAQMTYRNYKQNAEYAIFVQDQINAYNDSILNKQIDPLFNDIDLLFDDVIVRLYKDQPIKGWQEITVPDEEGNNQVVQVPLRMQRQINAKKSTAQNDNYIDTPLPFLQKGLVVKASKNCEEKYNVKSGMIVTINSTFLKDKRFYLDKEVQHYNYIEHADNTDLTGFEGYFKFNVGEIETIVKENSFYEKPTSDKE